MKPNHAKRKTHKQKFKNKPQPSKKTTAAADNVSNSPALQAAIKAADTHKNTSTKNSASPKQNTAAPAKGKKKRTQASAPAQTAAPKQQTATPQQHIPVTLTKPPAPRTDTAAKQPSVAPEAVTAAVADSPALRQQRTQAWKLAAAFACSALACAWLAQNSINAYWQQTYHRDSPLAAFNGSSLWQAGGRLYTAAEQAYRGSAVIAAPVPRIRLITEGGDQATDLAASAPSDNPAAADTSAAAAAPTVVLNSGDTVLFAGDSMMDSVAPHLQRHLKSEYRINSLNLSRQSTGLAYPSLFDWPATIEQTLAQNTGIKLVVVFLGPNDPWDFPNPAGGRDYLKFESPEWEAEYRRRIQRIVRAADEAGVALIWMGIPQMKSTKLNRQMRYLDGLYADEIQGRAIWLPTSELLDEGSGEYRDTITIDGKSQRIRSKDGIHFTLTGQKYLADMLARRLTLPAAADNANAKSSADGG